MSVFADTSAFYALLVRTDDSHDAVRAVWTGLLEAGRPVHTTSLVMVETMALLQYRIGLAAARDFDEDVLPVIRPHWVDEVLYRLGADRLWREDRRHVSLVDCVSFEFMKSRAIDTAFATDPHFSAAGFSVVPDLRPGRSA